MFYVSSLPPIAGLARGLRVGYPDHLDVLDIREHLAIHVTIGRGPGEGVCVDGMNDVDRRAAPAVGERASSRNDPVIAALGPGVLPECPISIEDPRAEYMVRRIP